MAATFIEHPWQRSNSRTDWFGITYKRKQTILALQWRHNKRHGVSNHQRCNCLFNRLFRRGSKKTSWPASLAIVRKIQRWPMNSPQKWPIRQKVFPFDDAIMIFQKTWVTSDSKFSRTDDQDEFIQCKVSSALKHLPLTRWIIWLNSGLSNQILF